MSQLKKYTAKDIEQYHNGQLSAAEMHALEKAALDDPFLADALEGYAHAKHPTTELDELQERLIRRIHQDEKKRKTILLPFGWMKIAALFILVAGAGWLIFQTVSSNQKPTEVATNKVVNQSPFVNPEMLPDSTSVVLNEPPVQQNLPNPEISTTNDYPKKANSTKTENANRRIPSAINNQDNRIASEQTESVMKFDYEVSKDSGRIASLAEVKPSSAFRMQAKEADTIKNVDIVLKKTELPSEEVVVVSKNKKAPILARSRMKGVVIDTLEPAEGWSNFDDYVANNLHPPEEYKTKTLANGEVELSFEINKNGEPVNITVVKSLCNKCDEEAVRLLKEGPKWKPSKKKGKLKIKF